MSEVLARICAIRRAALERRRAELPLAELEKRVAGAPPPRGFVAALETRIEGHGLALIAEIKRASPSRGLIRADFDPAALARAYEAGGAACLSVLTEADHFQGADEHLGAARAAVALPCLRKDFTLDPYQVIEARAIGADCILLILAALDNRTARELARLAGGLGLDVLAEVHDEAELERALALDVRLIGINNRDLRSLEVDLGVTERLAARVPEDRLLVSESGLRDHADLQRMAAAGARCFLVGESLMREPDVQLATAVLLGLIPAR